MEAKLTNEKIKQLDGYKKLVEEFKKEIEELEEKEKKFLRDKPDW